MSEKIRGMCVVITNPDGDVVAQDADFERCAPAGFDLEKAQEVRAGNGAKREFARGHLNGWLAKDMSGYFIRIFWENAERAGYKMTAFPVEFEAMNGGE